MKLFVYLFFFGTLLISCGKRSPVSDNPSLQDSSHIDTSTSAKIFNTDSLAGYTSDSLAIWIRSNLKVASKELKDSACKNLLKEIEYPGKISKELKGECISDSLNAGRYLVYLYEEESCLLVFVMDTARNSIIKAADWSHEAVDHFYTIRRFGKNYIASFGHTSGGTDNTWSFIFNQDLKKLLIITDNTEYWSEEPYSSQEMSTSYSLVNDSTLQLNVQFRNRELEKVKKEFKMQLSYRIEADTIICTNPDQLKLYDKKCREFNMN